MLFICFLFSCFLCLKTQMRSQKRYRQQVKWVKEEKFENEFDDVETRLKVPTPQKVDWLSSVLSLFVFVAKKNFTSTMTNDAANKCPFFMSQRRHFLPFFATKMERLKTFFPWNEGKARTHVCCIRHQYPLGQVSNGQ